MKSDIYLGLPAAFLPGVGDFNLFGIGIFEERVLLGTLLGTGERLMVKMRCNDEINIVANC